MAKKTTNLLASLVSDARSEELSLSILLNRLRAAAPRFARPDIAKWCGLELGGYMAENPDKTKEDRVPDYRTVPCIYRDQYGREVQLPKKVRDTGIQLVALFQSAPELEKMAAGRGKLLSVRDYDRFTLFRESLGLELSDCQISVADVGSAVQKIRERAVRYIFELDVAAEEDSAEDSAPVELLLRLFEKIRLAVAPLSKRRSGKPCIKLADEYDLQDVLHALMIPWFDDIRPEEWTPSYAGGSKRMDFLIADEKIAVELKFVKDPARATKISDEIVVDVEHYAQHPTVETLVALIFDPGLVVKKRAAVEKALTGPRVIGEKALSLITRVRPSL